LKDKTKFIVKIVSKNQILQKSIESMKPSRGIWGTLSIVIFVHLTWNNLFLERQRDSFMGSSSFSARTQFNWKNQLLVTWKIF